MSQQHQSQGSCEVRGWPGPMSLRSPAPAEGGLTLLPLSPADCKPPPGHERGAGELLRIAACLLAGLTHPPVNEIQRGKARQNTTSWEPRGLSRSQARCQSWQMPTSSRRRNVLTEAWK